MIIEAADKNGLKLEEGDVLVVAQKIFSKAENE
jgi:F420-0:gamma-glutamyl ligase